MTMRVGILGGTFNPIHYGHLISASQVMDMCDLSRVVLIPSATPPHKGTADLEEPHHRLIMTILGTYLHPRLHVSSIEMDRGGKSYSVETIQELRRLSAGSAELYFIAGMDAFQDIATWKDAETLLGQCHFIVTTRPGFDPDNLSEVLGSTITSRNPEITFEMAETAPAPLDGRITISGSRYSIWLLEITSVDISSTAIRRRVREGRSIKYLLPREVESYIVRHRLYTD